MSDGEGVYFNPGREARRAATRAALQSQFSGYFPHSRKVSYIANTLATGTRA
jgi:hypothetical protein